LSSTIIEKVSDGVSVPLSAINADGTGQYVWFVDPQTMKVAKRDVEVAEDVGEVVRVTRGLDPGDQIVGAGGAYLTEGVEVRPWIAE
jgi:multidrug efflux pump subunit AcrA (membrane-fusion protein)